MGSELVTLANINVTSPQAGHREKDQEQIEHLHCRFIDGEFGRSVAGCGVQLLAIEEDVCALLKYEVDFKLDKTMTATGFL